MIEIKDSEKLGFSSVSVDDEAIADMYECTIGVDNTDFPVKDADDSRTIVLELVHYTDKQDRTEPDTWTWNIIYNAYGDNHYLSEHAEHGENFFGSGVRTLDDAIAQSTEAFKRNTKEIKKVVSDIDYFVAKGRWEKKKYNDKDMIAHIVEIAMEVERGCPYNFWYFIGKDKMEFDDFVKRLCKIRWGDVLKAYFSPACLLDDEKTENLVKTACDDLYANIVDVMSDDTFDDFVCDFVYEMIATPEIFEVALNGRIVEKEE